MPRLRESVLAPRLRVACLRATETLAMSNGWRRRIARLAFAVGTDSDKAVDKSQQQREQRDKATVATAGRAESEAGKVESGGLSSSTGPVLSKTKQKQMRLAQQQQQQHTPLSHAHESEQPFDRSVGASFVETLQALQQATDPAAVVAAVDTAATGDDSGHLEHTAARTEIIRLLEEDVLATDSTTGEACGALSHLAGNSKSRRRIARFVEMLRAVGESTTGEKDKDKKSGEGKGKSSSGCGESASVAATAQPKSTYNPNPPTATAATAFRRQPPTAEPRRVFTPGARGACGTSERHEC